MEWRRGRQLPKEWQRYSRPARQRGSKVDYRDLIAARRRRRQAPWLLFGGAFLAVLGGGVALTRADIRLPTPTTPTDPANRFSCRVTGVHDGDGPIYCAEGPKIRLTAIAARELDETCNPGHPCPEASGASAQQELDRLASGHVLSCEKTGMSYQRTTAWCWREDGLELNCAMVQSGKALPWPKFDPGGKLCQS